MAELKLAEVPAWEDLLPQQREEYTRKQGVSPALAHLRWESARNGIVKHNERVDALAEEKTAQHKSQLDRIWQLAKDQYYARPQRGQGMPVPFSMLTKSQRGYWFALADDRVPPTWDELTFEQRRDYAIRRGLRTDPDRARQDYTTRRARNLRRRAARKIDHVNPYTVRGPNQRMADAAELTRMWSWARAENAAGRMNDLQLAVWEEHHRRALHAYTRPQEPYETP